MKSGAVRPVKMNIMWKGSMYESPRKTQFLYGTFCGGAAVVLLFLLPVKKV